MGDSGRAPLVGCRVAVTATRRAADLRALLSRYGADVWTASPITLAGSSDEELRRQTEALIADPPDAVIVTTAFGFREWIAAADGWGLADPLLAALSKAELLSRGPKETGALRGAGLVERWSTQSCSSHEMVRHLLAGRGSAMPTMGALAGRRVAVQLPGAVDDLDPMPELLAQLRGAGAYVLPIRVYRWRTARPDSAFDRLISETVDRRFDAVTFTSAPAVQVVLRRAGERGIGEKFLDALRTDVPAICVGPVTAGPLIRLGVPASWPPRMRLAALARQVVDELTRRQPQPMAVAGHRIEIRRSCVVVDGAARPLPPAEMATLRILAQRAGLVVPREELLRALPRGATSVHAVEVAVARLRTALGHKDIVATVVKRGYRLAVDEYSVVA